MSQFQCHEIEQGYLTRRPTLRIRKKNDDYIFTYKSKMKDAPKNLQVNDEVERPLTKEAYEKLREKTEGSAEKQNVKYHFRSPDILDLYEDFVLGDKTQALAEYNALGTYEKNNYWSATPNRIANVKFFDAILIDLQMLSPDAFAPLAAFSTVYGGQGVDLSLNADGTQRETSEIHVTGYNKAEYDALIEEAFLTRDAEARAAILHEAEEMLLDDMPIIPLTFGQAHYVKSRKLRNIDTTYYGYPILTDMKLKNYQKYLPEEGEN